MHTDLAELTEIILNGKAAGRIHCDPRLIPAPGQYLMAHAVQGLDAPLATSLFSAGACPGGFYFAPPLPPGWFPGTQLHIRGPLGKGFQFPTTARFVALVACKGSASRLLPLAEQALAQQAAVVLLTDAHVDGLPAAMEVSPLSALAEITHWADFLALDLSRDQLPSVMESINTASYSGQGQVLVETPIPCGGMGDCGICAIPVKQGYKLACKDGPVFDLKNLSK